MESCRPFTLNYNDYGASKEENLTDFAHRRNGKLAPTAPVSSSRHTLRDAFGNSQSVTSKGESDDAILSLLTANGYRVTSTKQLARLHDPDEYEAELNVMAEVFAYFEISSKRIVDIMPMIFETAFARNFENDLRKVLTSKLKLVGDSGLENCAKYVVDEPDIQVKRERFNRQKMILSNALGVVSGFFN
jgi:Dynamin GTPase effector domain